LQLKVLFMNKEENYLSDLSEIRSMMQKSTRFISLSGLSGVFVGLVALIGAAVGLFFLIQYHEGASRDLRLLELGIDESPRFELELRLLITAACVLIISLIGGYFFTSRKAKQVGQSVWTKSAQQLLANLFIPLAAGGVFCLGLYYHGYYGLIASSTLIFYGMALVNSSKYTLTDIRYLGISEIIVGLISLFFIGYGIYFWAFGFGILHIVYGISMYLKYDKK